MWLETYFLYLSIGTCLDLSFIVVWDDRFDVFAQIYDPHGNKKGLEFKVNTFTDKFQWYPDIAVSKDKSFIIVWSSWD